MKTCSTCLKKRLHKWSILKNCKICRIQWKAYYAGRTPVSPLARAITSETIKRVKKANKKLKKLKKAILLLTNL